MEDEREDQYYNPWTTSNVTEVIFELKENGFTKTGYSLEWWIVSIEGEDTDFYEGDEVEVSPAYNSNETTYTAYVDWISESYTIQLSNEDATTPGTSSIIERYGIGYFLSSGGKMTQSVNPIDVPVRDGGYTITFNYNMSGVSNTTKNSEYEFLGYYDGDTRIIDADGYIASGVSNTRYTDNNTMLRPKWSSARVVLPAPSLYGYVFKGWHLGSINGTKYDAGTSYSPNSNVTFYAEWEPDTWSITLNNMGGTSSLNSGEIYQLYGEYVTADEENIYDEMTSMDERRNPIPIPEKSYSLTYNYNYSGASANVKGNVEYSFEGYYENQNFNGEMIIDSNGYLGNDFSDGTYFNISSQLYADWSMKGFKKNGTTTYDRNLLNPSSRPGYEFIGWFTSSTGGTRITNLSQINSNQTLYAHWEAREYSIEYYDGDNLLDVDNGVYSGSIELMNFKNDLHGYVPSGFEFAGWVTDGGLSTIDDEDILYYDGAKAYITDSGFSLNNNVYVLKLYAVSKKDITFISDGNISNNQYRTQYYYNEEYTTVTVPDIKYNNNSMINLGWDTYNGDWANDKLSPTEIRSTTGGDWDWKVNSSTYYACYHISTSIEFYKNSNTATGSMSSQSVDLHCYATGEVRIVSSSFELPECEFNNSGYFFNEWILFEDDGETEWDRFEAGEDDFPFDDYYGYGIPEKIELYADWRRIPSSDIHKITLNDQGGSGGSGAYYEIGTQKYTATPSATAQAITNVNIPTKTGYVFNGYYTEDDDEGVDSDGCIHSNAGVFYGENTTLYASWIPRIYLISLNNNGAQNAGTTSFYSVYGVKYTAIASQGVPAITSITVPKKTGYTFKGYYTDLDEEGKPTVNAEQVVNENGTIVYAVNPTKNYKKFTNNRTLHAYWEVNQYDVTCVDYLVDSTVIGDLSSGKMTHEDFAGSYDNVKEIRRYSRKYNYNTVAYGSDFGTGYDNYLEYKGCTYKTVGTSGATIERFYYVYTNINIYNPDGIEDYESAKFSISVDGGTTWKYNMTNEEKMYLPYGSTIIIKDFTPYYDYYVLDKYYDNDNISSNHISYNSSTKRYTYTIGQYTTITNKLHFYMKYKTINITFNANGGVVNGSTSYTMPVTYGDVISNVPTPITTKSGYKFLGWVYKKDENNALDKYIEWNSDILLIYPKNRASWYQHFIRHGEGEGRRTSEVYNGMTSNLTSNITLYAVYINHEEVFGIIHTDTERGKPGIYVGGTYNSSGQLSSDIYIDVAEPGSLSDQVLKKMAIRKPDGSADVVDLQKYSGVKSTYKINNSRYPLPASDYPSGNYSVTAIDNFGGIATTEFTIQR